MNERPNTFQAIRFGTPRKVPNGLDGVVREVTQQGMMDEAVHGGTDMWGVRWVKTVTQGIAMVDHHPIEDLSAVDDYSWPAPEDFRVRDRDLGFLQEPETSASLVVAHHTSGIFERSWELVGMEKLLMAMLTEPDQVERLVQGIGRYHVAIARKWLEYPVDGMFVSDDYGSEESLIFSPELWRRFIKPQLARIVQVYKAAGKLVFLHSDGNIAAILDDLMEMGIDVLNPVQASCNDLKEMRERTQHRMCLYGGIDNRIVLHGTPEEVDDEVRTKLELLGRHGGYIAAPDQWWNFPDANVAAFNDAVQRHGRY